MAELMLKAVSKTLGGAQVLSNVDLEVRDGEFVVILGPSGSGKTTTLRCIAGLEPLDGGQILMDGKVINDLSPKERDVAMVFQNYAIYPTMSVRDNIAFPLMIRHMQKDQVDKQVRDVAALLSIEGLLARKPGQLSGGERQRVAVARAIIRKPKLFLMDEPLSNLDAKLRVQARSEIKRLQHELGVTTVFVTHDQAEAMALADRIAVMDKGIIQQFGPPTEIYDSPSNLMVAGFLGSPSMNFLDGKLTYVDGRAGAKVNGGIVLHTTIATNPRLEQLAGSEIIAGFRPEDTLFLPKAQPDLLPAEVYTVEPMGSQTVITIKAATLLKSVITSEALPSIGDKGAVQVRDDRVYLFERTSGRRLV